MIDFILARIMDDARMVIVTTGNINDFANLCGRFALVGDTDEMENWWYGLPEGERYMAVLSKGDVDEGDEVFSFDNGDVVFKKL